MRGKRFKLICYSMTGSDSKELLFSRKKLVVYLFSGFMGLAFLALMTVYAFLGLWGNTVVDDLQKQNHLLMVQLEKIDNKSLVLDQRVLLLEKENDDLRVFADMPVLDKGTRLVGVGGSPGFDNFDTRVLPKEVGEQVEDIHSLVEKLERRVNLYENDRKEIERKLAENKNKLKSTPSIQPVVKGRVTELYGYRTDPFTDVKKHHDGMDIGAKIGADVFAAADGVVSKVVKKYKRGVGYGKEIIIDHGDGVTTRYAHLSKILVKKNQQVKRWDVIGLVGDTGRSTGPHLHYEVMIAGKQVDPNKFIVRK